MPAAAATDTISTVLDRRISGALTDHGIRHGALSAGPPNLNLNLTDRANVFVKISRPGERTIRPSLELAGASWAARHGLPTVVPLLDRVLDLDDEHGEARAVTLWAWIEPATGPGLIDQSRTVADLIATINYIPAPPDAATFDLSFFRNRVDGRLHGLTCPEATAILTAASESGEAIAARLDPTTYRWIHGDLHTENILWPVAGRAVVLDWESHTLGPVEWDVAQLVRSVHNNFPRHAIADKRRALADVTRRLASRMDIDLELVDLCVRFRAASSASHLLVHGHQPARLAADIALIADLSFRVRSLRAA